MTDTKLLSAAFPNPIGFLNEFCQKTVTPFPVFNIINKKGPNHSPMFIIECVFKGSTFEGSGLTIKKAKDNAAREAIKSLKLMDTKKDEEVKPLFKLVECSTACSAAGNLENFWNGSESIFKITIRKKEGDLQKFKSFLVSKIQELEYKECE